MDPLAAFAALLALGSVATDVFTESFSFNGYQLLAVPPAFVGAGVGIGLAWERRKEARSFTVADWIGHVLGGTAGGFLLGMPFAFAVAAIVLLAT